MNSKVVKRFGVAALLFGGALAALAGGKPPAGQDDDAGPRRLVGSWNVILRFPVCSSQCPCPGGVPSIPIPALQTYLPGESMIEAGGGSLFRGPGLGSWEHDGRHEFTAHFKFFVFKPDGTPRGNEVVTSHVDLTQRDAFDANATFDLFDLMGNKTTPPQGCPITESGVRFE